MGFGSGLGFNFDIKHMCPGISAALVADGFLISLRNFTKICALHFATIIERERERGRDEEH